MKYFLIFLLFLPFSLFAQESLIAGKVKETKNDTFLKFTSISLLNLPHSKLGIAVIADINGNLKLKEVPGDYLLRFDLQGYEELF